MRLRLQEQRRRFLPELQVVVEQQHRRQGRGEVINLRPGFLELLRVGEQIAEQFPGLAALPEFYPRLRGVISHFAEGANAHFLEVAFETGGGQPMLPGLFGVTVCGPRATEPVMDVALVGEQMLGFAQIARRGERVFKVRAGLCKITFCQCQPTQSQLGAHVLTEWAAFATFPRLELTTGNQFRRWRVLAGLIVECAQFHA